MGHPLEHSSKEPHSREAPLTFVEPAPPTFVEPSKITQVIFDDPVARPAAKEEIGSIGRRNFFGRVAAGTIALGGGAIGGMGQGGLAKALEGDSTSAGSVQELYDDRNFRFVNSIAAANPESMKLAKERIEYYSKQIRAIGDEITKLQMELAHSSHDSGKWALLENELSLLKYTQDGYVERMQFLKDPVGAFTRTASARSDANPKGHT